MNRGSSCGNAKGRRGEDAGVQGPRVEALDGIVGQSTAPVAMVNRHAMNSGQAIVVREVEYYNMEDEGCMRRFDLMFRSEVNGYAILPLFQFPVKLSYRIEEFTVGLFRCFDGVQLFVHFARDASKRAHQPKQVDFAFAFSKWDIANVVRRIFTW
jgi:hypothetical protein